MSIGLKSFSTLALVASAGGALGAALVVTSMSGESAPQTTQVTKQAVSAEAVVSQTQEARLAAQRAEAMLEQTRNELNELRTMMQAGLATSTPERQSGTTIAQEEPLQTARMVNDLQTPEQTAASCVDEMREASQHLTIYFNTGGAVLDEKARLNTRMMGELLKRCSHAVIHVTGHSDSSGDETANLNLSWARADAVVRYMETLGFDTSHVDAVGFGTRMPSAQGDADLEMDRRVEFHILEMH